MGKIVVIGSSNTDMVIRVPRLPKQGETVLGGEFLMAAGGKGANQAVAAARAGGDVTLIARVGDDEFGQRALEGFKKERIDVEFVKVDKEAASGIALIFVDSEGENAIAVASGANARLTPEDVEDAALIIADADVLLMQLEVPIETVDKAAEIASLYGVKTILNPAPAQLLAPTLLRRISILTPNATETEILTGIRPKLESDMRWAAAELMKKVQSVVITLGERGAYLATATKGEFIRAPKVQAVDTTAAGDVFNGAMAVALAEGRSLKEATQFGIAAAALSVSRMTAQPSAPLRLEIEGMLATGFGL